MLISPFAKISLKENVKDQRVVNSDMYPKKALGSTNERSTSDGNNTNQPHEHKGKMNHFLHDQDYNELSDNNFRGTYNGDEDLHFEGTSGLSGLRRIDYLLGSRSSRSPSQENYDPGRPSTPSDDFSFNLPSPNNSSSRDYYDSLLSSCANQATRNNVSQKGSTGKRPKLDYNTGSSTSPTQNYFKSVNAHSTFMNSALTTSAHAPQLVTSATYGSRSSPGTNNDSSILESENRLLRKRVEELKKQVSDLMATNEFLLEQNARFRNHQFPRHSLQNEAITSLAQTNIQNSMAPIMSQNISAAASLGVSTNSPLSQQTPITQALNPAAIVQANQIMTQALTPSSLAQQSALPLASSASVIGSNISSCMTSPMSNNLQQTILPTPQSVVPPNTANITASGQQSMPPGSQNMSSPMTTNNIQQNLHVAAQVVQQAQQVAAQVQQAQQAQVAAQVQQAQQVAAQVQQAQVAAQVQQAQQVAAHVQQAQVAAQVQQAQVAAQHVAAQQAQVAAQVQAQVQQAVQQVAATIAASVPNMTQSMSFNTSRPTIPSSFPSNTNSICTISQQPLGPQNAPTQPPPSAPHGKPMILSSQSTGGVNQAPATIPITVACSLPVSLGALNSGLAPPTHSSSLAATHTSLGSMCPQNSMGPLMSAQLAMASVGGPMGVGMNPPKNITQPSPQQQQSIQQTIQQQSMQQQTIQQQSLQQQTLQQSQGMSGSVNLQSSSAASLQGQSGVHNSGPVVQSRVSSLNGPAVQQLPPPPPQSIQPRHHGPTPSQTGRVSSSGNNSQHLISYPMISRSK